MFRFKSGKATLFIDGSNLHATCKILGFTIDYKRLLDAFEGTIYKAYYFTAMPPETEQSTLRPMVDYLDYNGYIVVKKLTKEFNQSLTFRCDGCGENNVRNTLKIKGNMDVEMAVTACEIGPYMEDVYLFTGDGDFRFLVESLQRRYGCRVAVVSSIKTQPVMCADILRRQADMFIELADMRDEIGRVDDNRRRA